MPIPLLLASLLALSSAQDKPELLLGNFDRPEDSRLWEAGGAATMTIEPRDPTDRNKACKLVFSGGSYGGISSFRLPKDWSRYEVLSFVVWSPDRRGMGVRVDDDNSKNYATRYNGDVTLEAGRNLVQIPIAQMKAAIDPSKVRYLVLFLMEPPKGLILYIDDIRLGARETDKVAFIPYEKRLEFVPTTDVASPHFTLARPLAGGPLKVMAIYDIEEGRDLSELMQRIDLRVSPISWSNELGVQKWNGVAYGERSYDGSRRYLASTAQGPEKFDTMLVATPTGWNLFGKAATESIIDRVRNRGEGLVLVFPFPGEKHENPWPEDLKALSALVDSETDFQRDNGYVRPALGGHVVGKKWRVAKEHPIVSGVALDALPFEALDVQAYKPAPGAEVLLETETGQPVLAVREVGKGRVVTFAVRSHSLTPHVPDAGAKRQWRDYRYWEVFHDLLARAALWSARRDLPREGSPAAAPPRADDGGFSLRQWKNAKGEVTSWQLDFKADAVARLKVTAPEVVARGGDVTVTFEPSPGAAHVARLVDYAGARRRTLVERPAEGASVTLPTQGLDSLALVAEVEATAGSRRVALGEATVYFTPKADWDDYEVYGWSAGGISYLRDLQMETLREFGLTTEQVGGVDDARASFRRGFRIHAMNGATGLHCKDFDHVYREYLKTGDPKLLVRDPSFADPAFLDRQRSAFSGWAKAMAPYSPLTMSLGDETSLTSYVTEFDFDFHPENLRTFRQKMKAKFGDVAAMNAALGCAWASFDEGLPPTTAEARKSGKWGLWSEWRDHNDELWTGAFQFYRDVMRKEYPPTRLSVSGTQVSHVFNGIDWARLAPVMGATADYTGRFQLTERMNFNPSIRSTPWVGYGRTGPGAAHQLWSNLSFDGSGTAFFWYPSILNADFTLSASSRDYFPTLQLLRTGLGKEFLLARRRYSPVAVLWSPHSQRAAWTEGKLGEFEKTEHEAYRALVAAGADPFFISEAGVASGELEKKGVRVLVLPMSISFGRKAMLPAVQAWKGEVLATHPVSHDEFLLPRPLADADAARFHPFPKNAGELEKALLAAGAAPEASVLAFDGKRMPRVVLSMHAFPSHPDSALLLALRDPVGEKEEAGADGVIHMVPDPEGGRPVEPGLVDVSRFPGRHFFDVRARKELVPDGGRLKVDLKAGDAVVIAVLPAAPSALDLSAKRAGDRLSIAVSGKGRTGAPHVLRLDVVPASTGKPDPLYSRNLVLDASGSTSAEIPLAIEDRKTAFKVVARDVLTGAETAGTY
jgi:hypothetical protein